MNEDFNKQVKQKIINLCKERKQYLPFEAANLILKKSFNRGSGALDLAQFIYGYTFVNKNALFRNDLERIKAIAPNNTIIFVPNFNIWDFYTLKGKAKELNLF